MRARARDDWSQAVTETPAVAGLRAIARFRRPVCYQDMPSALLAPALRGEGAPHMPVRRDGRHVKGSAA